MLQNLLKRLAVPFGVIETHGVVALEDDAVGVDVPVAVGARRVSAVDLELLLEPVRDPLCP